jgi:hypothetical protein
MKIGYDCDGVLAEGPPKSPVRWGKMNGEQRQQRRLDLLQFYANARPILKNLPGPIAVVITARKATPEIERITRQWLETHHGELFCGQLELFNGTRSIENVVAFKAQKILEHGCTDFIEDNLQVVRGLRALLPRVKIWRLQVRRGGLIDLSL